MRPMPPATMLTSVLMAFALATAGCTHFAMEPCEDDDVKVLGNNTPGTVRIRTSHHRALLSHPDEVAGRLLPYALMSAYAYYMRPGCNDPGNPVRVSADRAEKLNEFVVGVDVVLNSLNVVGQSSSTKNSRKAFNIAVRR